MIRAAFAFGLALTPVIAEAQTYRTYPNARGATTYGSDGSVARTYD